METRLVELQFNLGNRACDLLLLLSSRRARQRAIQRVGFLAHLSRVNSRSTLREPLFAERVRTPFGEFVWKRLHFRPVAGT